MKNITLSADETLIEQARQRAESENTTLNKEFRRWLASYATNDAESRRRVRAYDEFMQSMKGASIGGPFSRDELNER